MKLSMNVATNGDRSLDELGVGLIAEDLFSFLNNKLDLFLCDGLKGLDVFDDEIEVIIVLAHGF
jgi:hypothetical protein